MPDGTEPMSKIETAPAVGVSLQHTITDNRAIVFQTHIPQEASLAECNAIVDKLMMVADRQKARYDLEAIERDLAANQARLLQQDKLIESAEADYATACAKREVEIETL